MNTKLLRKVAEAFMREPWKLDMRLCHIGPDGRSTTANCATAHCIAGWTEVVTGVRCDAVSVKSLWKTTYGQTSKVCHLRNWPIKFQKRYRAAKLDSTRARIAAQRIEHFIATKGEE